MPRKFLSLFIFSLLFCLLTLAPRSCAATGARAMVVTSDPRATEAALKVLEKGGNAADALVAAQAVLNVTEPHASGIGGAGHLLFYDAGTRRVLYFDGNAKASRKTSAEMFLAPDGRPKPYAERRASGIATGVPGTVKLLREFQLKYGSVKFSFGKLLEPAITLAEKGTPVSEELAAAIASGQKLLAGSSYAGRTFFKNGAPVKAGDNLIQPDLAKTFRELAAQKKEDDVFYRGRIAKEITGSFGRSPDTALTRKDLSGYDLKSQPPLYGSYEGYDLFVPPPPSAGGVMTLASCNLLARLGLAAMSGKPEGIHWVSEVSKISQEIPPVIGDPELFDLPVPHILSQAWTEQQVLRLQTDKVFRPAVAPKGSPGRDSPAAASSVLICDKSGSVAAYTGTLGSPFGSGVMVPGGGFFLNDLLNGFDMGAASLRDPDAVNVPEAAARPRNFAAMALVFKEGKPALVLNSLDAERSSAVVVNLLAQWAAFQTPCENLISVPRVLDAGGVMQMEKPLYGPADTARVKLELIGHKIEARDRLGNAQVICYESDTGKLSGQSDPRAAGSAAGI